MFRYKISLGILFLCNYSLIFGAADSLKQEAQHQVFMLAESPAQQVEECLKRTQELLETDLNQAEQCLLLADSVMQTNHLNKFNSRISYLKAEVEFSKGNLRQALSGFLEAELMFTDENNAQGLANTYNKLGLINISQADFPTALDYFIKSLTLKEQNNDTMGIADTYSNIGNALFELNDTDHALNYYLKSLEMDKKQLNESGMAKTLMNVGLVYKENFAYEKAMDYYNQSLAIHKKNNNQHEIATCYSNLALIYQETGNDDKALEFYKLALSIYEQTGAKMGIASVLSNLGYLHSLNEDYPTAISYLKDAMRIAQEINAIPLIEIISQSLSDAYQRMGNYREAYNYHLLYKAMYDKLNNDENARQFTQMEMTYEFEQQKKELEFRQQQKELEHQAELKRQRLILQFSLAGAFFLAVFLVFVYRSYQQKQRDNKLLQEQKKAIEEQRDKINKQNQDITDSIHYARRIQTALLPPDNLLDKLLPEYFILYKPRDIVSGDYYWASEKNGKTVLVAADCTGHGVPGAFMSMLGISFLNEIIQRETELSCSNILNKLRDNVIASLRQTGKVGETKDGMDLTIIIIDKNTQTLQYSGAYNPLLLVRQGELVQYKADKMPIGISDKAESTFTNQEIQLEKNDTLYMFSDGYVDQFGGPDNSKFKSKPFKELLLSIQSESMAEQQQILDHTIESWKGNTEQIDDILVVGIRI
jgi:serine phosphatase RsbU (regulator of sigma subunit)/Flp pilus assembly protein TadD